MNAAAAFEGHMSEKRIVDFPKRNLRSSFHIAGHRAKRFGDLFWNGDYWRLFYYKCTNFLKFCVKWRVMLLNETKL